MKLPPLISGDLVRVEWDDAHTVDGWTYKPEDVIDLDNAHVVTAGHYAGTAKGFIAIAATRTVDGAINAVQAIPVANITAVKVLA